MPPLSFNTLPSVPAGKSDQAFDEANKRAPSVSESAVETGDLTPQPLSVGPQAGFKVSPGAYIVPAAYALGVKIKQRRNIAIMRILNNCFVYKAFVLINFFKKNSPKFKIIGLLESLCLTVIIISKFLFCVKW